MALGKFWTQTTVGKNGRDTISTIPGYRHTITKTHKTQISNFATLSVGNGTQDARYLSLQTELLLTLE